MTKTETRDSGRSRGERGRTTNNCTVVSALALTAALLCTTASAQGASCTVTSLGDSGAGTLRDAIVAQTCDTIDFSVQGTIALTSGLAVSRNLAIAGPGAHLMMVQVNNSLLPVIRVMSGATVAISGVTITGGSNGSSSSDGGGIENLGTLTLDNSTVSHNHAASYGGGIQNIGVLTLNNCIVSRNQTNFVGGGINNSGGTLTINNSTVTENYAEGHGGGISSFGGTVRINNSSVSKNTVGEEAGGIFNNGSMLISNSTVSGNVGNYNASGIKNSATLEISNSTVAANTANTGGAAILTFGTLNLFHSIVVDSHMSINGPVTAGEYNLIGSIVASGPLSPTNRIGVNALLGPLQNNGGSTLTHALSEGSPAIDAGDPNFNEPNLLYDQRGSGFARVSGGRIDIGAFEYSRPYPFSGFLQPVHNLPTVNGAKAGSTVPVKFSLGGNRSSNIFAAGSPSSQQIACDTAAPLSEMEATVTAGASSLSYDAATDTYTYVWKTSTAWKNTCIQLIVKLSDNTTHLANFQFK